MLNLKHSLKVIQIIDGYVIDRGRFKSRTGMNNLVIQIRKCTGLKSPVGKGLAAYVSFILYNEEAIFTVRLKLTSKNGTFGISSSNFLAFSAYST